MVTGPTTSARRSMRILSKWGRFCAMVIACGAAFACTETIVWATYTALDHQVFDLRKAFVRPFSALTITATTGPASPTVVAGAPPPSRLQE